MAWLKSTMIIYNISSQTPSSFRVFHLLINWRSDNTDSPLPQMNLRFVRLIRGFHCSSATSGRLGSHYHQHQHRSASVSISSKWGGPVCVSIFIRSISYVHEVSRLSVATLRLDGMTDAHFCVRACVCFFGFVKLMYYNENIDQHD